MLISRWSGAAVGPDKSRYRTSAVLEPRWRRLICNPRGDHLFVRDNGPSIHFIQVVPHHLIANAFFTAKLVYMCDRMTLALFRPFFFDLLKGLPFSVVLLFIL